MLIECNFLRDIIQPLLAVLVDASAGLPVLAILGLLIGRRGHANFCLDAFRQCLKLGLLLGLSGMLFYPISCYLLLYKNETGLAWLAIFASLPGMPWFSAWIAWLTGYCLVFLAFKSACRVTTRDDRFVFSEIKMPVLLGTIAALCLAASFFLVTWPFAGMPAELSTQRVLVAISRNTLRHWFAALSCAGAVTLACAPLILAKIRHSQTEKDNALRWCAVWAFGAALPSGLANLGLLIGILVRGHASVLAMPGAYAQIIAVSCGTLAILCWVWCFFRKSSGCISWLGFLLLLGKTYAPQLNSFLF